MVGDTSLVIHRPLGILLQAVVAVVTAAIMLVAVTGRLMVAVLFSNASFPKLAETENGEPRFSRMCQTSKISDLEPNSPYSISQNGLELKWQN